MFIYTESILFTWRTILEEYEDLADWFVFLDEAGRVKPSLLTKVLQKYDLTQNIFCYNFLCS